MKFQRPETIFSAHYCQVKDIVKTAQDILAKPKRRVYGVIRRNTPTKMMDWGVLCTL